MTDLSNLAARTADALLELTVVGGLTIVGFEVRRRLDHWGPPVTADLSGRHYLVTGATSGIGRECASLLMAAGATVHSTSRQPDRAAAAEAELKAAQPRGDARITTTDLTRPAAVADYGAQLADTVDALHGVAHCAGAFHPDFTRTPEGLEANTAVYVLGPHLLNHAVAPLLTRATAPRVVFVSSSGAYARALSLRRLDPDPGHYRGLDSYAHAKRAQIALAHGWAARRPDIAFDAMTPGWCDTELLRRGLPRFRAFFRPILRTSAQGADTLAWLLSGDQPRPTNRLWRDRRPRLEHRLPWTLAGDSPDDLWRWCEAQRRLLDRGPAASPTTRRD